MVRNDSVSAIRLGERALRYRTLALLNFKLRERFGVCSPGFDYSSSRGEPSGSPKRRSATHSLDELAVLGPIVAHLRYGMRIGGRWSGCSQGQ